MDDLIYSQQAIPGGKWRYGLRKSAATGCGWIATYNALRLMGYKADPEKIIAYYEKMLPIIHGNAGTLAFAPAVFFKKHGFSVKTTAKTKNYDEAAKNADVSLLFYHWRKGVKLGAHFVAVRHTGAGFFGYNTYRSSTGPDPFGGSLEAFIKRKKYFGTVLIAVTKDPNR